MTLRLRKRFWVWAPALLYLALITVVSHIRLGTVHLAGLTYGDKIAHGIEYALLCLLVFRVVRIARRPRLRRWAPLAALALASAYGAIDEWHQGFVGRDCDLGDWLADTIGAAAVAVALMVYVELHDHPADTHET